MLSISNQIAIKNDNHQKMNRKKSFHVNYKVYSAYIGNIRESSRTMLSLRGIKLF